MWALRWWKINPLKRLHSGPLQTVCGDQPCHCRFTALAGSALLVLLQCHTSVLFAFTCCPRKCEDHFNYCLHCMWLNKVDVGAFLGNMNIYFYWKVAAESPKTFSYDAAPKIFSGVLIIMFSMALRMKRPISWRKNISALPGDGVAWEAGHPPSRSENRLHMVLWREGPKCCHLKWRLEN